MTPRRSLIAASAALPLALPATGRAQATRVRFTMDWAFQAPQTFGLLARDRGFFREAGIDISIDRGQGSGGVPVALAGGTHDMGYADLSPTLRFLAEDASRDVLAIAILHDRSPLCVIARADGPIRNPRDLEGRRLAAPEFDAARQLFPAFARAAGFDAARVQFISVQPALREPMFIRRDADGLTASVQTSAIALVGLGVALDQQRLLMYSDHGLDLYGGALLTTRAFAERNPDAVRRVVAAMLRGFLAQIADPAAAMAALQRAEPLTDPALELQRHNLMMERMVLSDHVRRNGLSQLQPARLQSGLDAIQTLFGFPARTMADRVYTDRFLPPAAELRLPAGVG